jgi:hypothetical protein
LECGSLLPLWFEPACWRRIVPPAEIPASKLAGRKAAASCRTPKLRAPVLVDRAHRGKDADRKIGGPRYALAPENRPTRVIPAKAGIHPLPRDLDPRLRGGDEVIFMSSDGPQAHGNSVEGSRQQGEIRLGEFVSPPEQAHDDKESGKKRTPEFQSAG